MGFSPKQWGNEGWHLIHYVTLNYPSKPTEEDKKRYMGFLESLQYVLPCEGCSYNWGLKLKENPPKLDNRKEFFQWSVDMHNEVNKSHGKKELTYEEALNRIAKKKQIELIKDSILLCTFTIGFLTMFSYVISKRLL